MAEDLDTLIMPRNPLREDPFTQTAEKVLSGPIESLLTLPKRAFEASEGLRYGMPYDPGPAVETTMMGMGAGLPFAEKGAAGIFGGRLGAGAGGKMRLDWAENMAAKGEDADKIWRQTGWYKHPGDDTWRFELAPEGFKMKGTAYKSYGSKDGSFKFHADKPEAKETKLIDVIEHPSLLKAYPEFADMPVRIIDNYGSEGAYLPPDPIWSGPHGAIVLRKGMSERETQDTLIHELQHAVQQRENFLSKGISPPGIRQGVETLIQQKLKTVKPSNPEYQKILDAWDKLQTTPNINFSMYERNPGEIEARYASMRQHWSEAERKSISPQIALENLTNAGIFPPEFRLPAEMVRKQGSTVLSNMPPEVASKFKPVDYDPFKFKPVDHDPFK